MLDKKKEHGDYQTPLDFANKVVKYIKDNYDFIPNFIIEPNCGIGNFFKAAEQYYKSEMLGIEINKNYSEIAKKNNPKAMIYNQSIFEYKWEKNIKKFGNGRAEFASAGFISDVPLNILLNRYLTLYLTAPCLKNQPL